MCINASLQWSDRSEGRGCFFFGPDAFFPSMSTTMASADASEQAGRIRQGAGHVAAEFGAIDFSKNVLVVVLLLNSIDSH